MVNENLEVQRQIIKHYWLNVTHSPKEIQELTNILLHIIECNIKKLKENGSVEHGGGNGWPTKVTQNMSRAIGQNLRRKNTISTRQLAIKIENTYDIPISHVSIWKHMKKKGYRSSIPLGIPMLTERHIEMRLTWAKAHLHDDWNETIFTDETAFDLFRNKVCQWY